jgi:hypothetical protein
VLIYEYVLGPVLFNMCLEWCNFTPILISLVEPLSLFFFPSLFPSFVPCYYANLLHCTLYGTAAEFYRFADPPPHISDIGLPRILAYSRNYTLPGGQLHLSHIPGACAFTNNISTLQNLLSRFFEGLSYETFRH